MCSMAYNNVITLVVVNLIICCFFSLFCTEAVGSRNHLESNSAIARLKRMEASIKAVQSGRTSTQEGGAVAPLSRWDTTHVVSIGIGTPPETFHAQVDTGSDLISVQCDPCTNCKGAKGYTPRTFYPRDSSTYRRVPCSSSLCSVLRNSTCGPDCQYSYIYRESWSAQGNLSYETFTMADTSGAAHSFGGVAFGCSHAIQGDGVEWADGVLGLGRGQLSLISQIGESKFSYCLSFEYYESSVSSFSTPLLFGSAADLNGTGVQYTMMINNTVLPKLNSYYYLSLEGISVGNVSLNIPRGTFDIQADGSGGFIIDSATRYTVLPHAAFTALASVLDSVMGLPRSNGSIDRLSLCYSSPYFAYVPDLNMTFHMAGADYVIEGKRNFVKSVQTVHPAYNLEIVLCLAMLDMDEASVAGVPAVLGNFQQQDFHILYDNANQRLSFTPIRCGSLYMSPDLSYVQSKAPILTCHALLLLLLLYFVALLLTL